MNRQGPNALTIAKTIQAHGKRRVCGFGLTVSFPFVIWVLLEVWTGEIDAAKRIPVEESETTRTFPAFVKAGYGRAVNWKCPK